MNDLTYNQITFKASHNSEDRKESIIEQLSFDPKKPFNNACMGIEFDIWRHSSSFQPYRQIDRGYFTVAHSSPGKVSLASYFEQLLRWHYQNPMHDAILISLDIKSSQGGYSNFHDEIDTYLKCYFDERLFFRPSQLFRNPSLSLCENVVEFGWPRLQSAELRGKFIFCLTGNKDWKAKYAETHLERRICFSDKDVSTTNPQIIPPKSGDIVFFNFHIYNRDRKIWMKTIPLFAQRRLITRTYIANSKENWNDCIKSNVSAIATDMICNHKWAKVSSDNVYRAKMITQPAEV